jgi:PST family polysaccharide transporter
MYRQALQLVLVPIQHLSGPLRSVGDVALSRLQGDADRYRLFYQKFLALTAVVTMPVMILAAVLAEDVVQILLGPRWTEAAPVVRITAMAGLLGPVVTTGIAVSLSCGHAKRLLQFAALEFVAHTVLFVAGVPWGMVGVASAHLWVAGGISVPSIWWFFRGTPIDVRLFGATIARPGFASVCMAGVLMLLRSSLVSSPFQLLMCGALAIAVYGMVLVALPGGADFVTGLFSGRRNKV